MLAAVPAPTSLSRIWEMGESGPFNEALGNTMGKQGENKGRENKGRVGDYS